MKRLLKFISITLFTIVSIVLYSCNDSKADYTYEGNISYESFGNKIDFSLTLSNDSINNFEVFYIDATSSDTKTYSFNTSDTSGTLDSLNNDTTYELVLYLIDNDTRIELDSQEITTESINNSYFSFENKTLTYDAKYHSIEVSCSQDIEYNVSYVGNNVKDPGEHKVVATITQDDYDSFTLTAYIIIEKAELSDFIDTNNIVCNYSGYVYTPSFSYEGLTYKYLSEKGTYVDEIVDVGKYYVFYSFNGDDYYNSCSGQYSVEIIKNPVSFAGSSKVLTIEEASSYVPDDFNIVLDVTYKYFLDGVEVSSMNKVGIYTVVAIIEECDNYEGAVFAYEINVVSEDLSSDIVFAGYLYHNGALYLNFYNLGDSYYINTNKEILINGETQIIQFGVASHDSSTIALKFGSGSVEEFCYDNIYYYESVESVVIDDVNIDLTENVSYFCKNVDGVISLTKNDSSILPSNIYYYRFVSREIIIYGYEDSISYTNVDSIEGYVIYPDSNYDIVGINSDAVCASNSNTYQNLVFYYQTLSSTLTFSLDIYVIDDVAPVVETTEEASIIYTNENVSILDFFTIYDEADGVIEVGSDLISGTYDLDNEGTYKICITVSDSSENTTVYYYKLYVKTSLTTYSNFVEPDSIRTLSNKKRVLPSTGEYKGLVIPISLDTENEDDSLIEKINTAFNGGDDSTYYSVSEYYYESSYHKLDLTFDVYDEFVRTNYKALYYEAIGYTAVIEEILPKLEDKIDFSQYDYDSDGYVDGIWFMYNIAYSYTSKVFWAWQWNYQLPLTVDGMKIANYVFASTYFLDPQTSYLSSYNESKDGSTVSARVIIHETGHMFGLLDYYSGSTTDLNLMYGYDMMEGNYGDHNSASKFLLGWIDPIVVDTTTTYTLSPFTTSGEALIIKNAYSNGNNLYLDSSKNIFDEYIIVEYYTYDNLNSFDNETIKIGEGIRILYMDARKNSGGSNFKYSNTPTTDGYTFLKTLPQCGDNTSDTGQVLYQEGNDFGQSVYNDFTFNSGAKLDFDIYILSLLDTKAELQIRFR